MIANDTAAVRMGEYSIRSIFDERNADLQLKTATLKAGPLSADMGEIVNKMKDYGELLKGGTGRVDRWDRGTSVAPQQLDKAAEQRLRDPQWWAKIAPTSPTLSSRASIQRLQLATTT